VAVWGVMAETGGALGVRVEWSCRFPAGAGMPAGGWSRGVVSATEHLEGLVIWCICRNFDICHRCICNRYI